MTENLRWTRQASSRFARTDTQEIAVFPASTRGWVVQVKDLTTTAGVQHALGQPVLDMVTVDTVALALATGQHYARMTYGNGAGARRLSRALNAAYDDEAAARRG